MTTLVLQRIGFEASHGATAIERRGTRRFEVDVEIDAAVEAAGHSDRVADTVDYRRIAETVVRVGKTGPHRLLESVASRIVGALVEIAPPGAVVRVELRKFSPPSCAGDPAVAAVRMSSNGGVSAAQLPNSRSR